MAWIDSLANPTTSETVELAAACGRVLTSEVTAQIDVPPFDRSAMDGYALRGAQTVGAGDYNPLSFRLLGESMPGHAFDGEVSDGTAVRIMTGAPMPAGADAVVPAEYARLQGDQVHIVTAVPPQKHVGFTGEDVKAGTRILPAGRQLRPQDVGLLASVGVSRVDVVRRPRIRIVVTGNELATPGTPRSADQIFESNSYVLRSLVNRDGGDAEPIAFAEDSRPVIRDRLAAPGADLVIVSGGSSVGAEDYAPTIVADEGELAIHGVAMRPASPTGMGRLGKTLVFLLPGNPVACLCAYDFFVGRAIRLLGGRSAEWPYVSRQAALDEKISSAVGRVDYCRVQFQGDRLQPLAISGASILSSTTRADGFVVIPAECEGYAPGTVVKVYLYTGNVQDSHTMGESLV